MDPLAINTNTDDPGAPGQELASPAAAAPANASGALSAGASTFGQPVDQNPVLADAMQRMKEIADRREKARPYMQQLQSMIAAETQPDAIQQYLPKPTAANMVQDALYNFVHANMAETHGQPWEPIQQTRLKNALQLQQARMKAASDELQSQRVMDAEDNNSLTNLRQFVYQTQQADNTNKSLALKTQQLELAVKRMDNQARMQQIDQSQYTQFGGSTPIPGTAVKNMGITQNFNGQPIEDGEFYVLRKRKNSDTPEAFNSYLASAVPTVTTTTQNKVGDETQTTAVKMPMVTAPPKPSATSPATKPAGSAPPPGPPKLVPDPAYISQLGERVQANPDAWFTDKEIQKPGIQKAVGEYMTSKGYPIPQRQPTDQAKNAADMGRQSLEHIRLLNEFLKDPYIQSQLGPIVGRIEKGVSAVGMDDLNVPPERTAQMQEFLTLLNATFFREARVLMPGRPAYQLLPQIKATSPGVQMAPARFSGALAGIQAAAQISLNNERKSMYGADVQQPVVLSGTTPATTKVKTWNPKLGVFE